MTNNFSECKKCFFFTLVGFEYRKIFKRKSTYFAFFLIILVIAFSAFANITGYSYVNGVEDESHYEQMKKNREFARQSKGYIDEEKISSVIEQIQKAYSKEENLINRDGEKFLSHEANQKYIRPYGELVRLIENVYGLNGNSLVNVDAKEFYSQRLVRTDEMFSMVYFDDKDIDKYKKINSEVDIPFYYDHFKGYAAVLERSAIVSIFITLAVSICLAPIFSGEYINRTDQLILTSKTGKNKEISAKIFAGISFSILLSAISLVLLNLSILSVYGFDGANVSIQVLNPFLPYSINMLQAVLIMMFVSIMAIILFSMLTMFMSAKMKTSFAVITVSNLILFVPMFIPIGRNQISDILRLLPSKIFEMQYVLTYFFLHFGKMVFTPYVFLPIFCLFASIILLPFVYRAFKNHQVG